MSNLKNPIFVNKIKNIFWPIERSEIKLFLPLGLMMMCMLFNFGSLRSIKDSLVVPNIGAEVISFLKLWLVLPSTIIFTLIYVRLSNIFEYDRLFYINQSQVFEINKNDQFIKSTYVHKNNNNNISYILPISASDKIIVKARKNLFLESNNELIKFNLSKSKNYEIKTKRFKFKKKNKKTHFL
jgi:hypothetical protein